MSSSSIDETIWKKCIMEFISPSDYMSLLLTSSNLNLVVRNSDCFKFVYMVTQWFCWEKPFPSQGYLQSKAAMSLYNIVKYYMVTSFSELSLTSLVYFEEEIRCDVLKFKQFNPNEDCVTSHLGLSLNQLLNTLNELIEECRTPDLCTPNTILMVDEYLPYLLNVKEHADFTHIWFNLYSKFRYSRSLALLTLKFCYIQSNHHIFHDILNQSELNQDIEIMKSKIYHSRYFDSRYYTRTQSFNRLITSEDETIRLVKSNCGIWSLLPKIHHLNRNIALALVRSKGELIDKIKHFHDDHEIVSIAVNSNPEHILHIQGKLRMNKEILLASLAKAPKDFSPSNSLKLHFDKIIGKYKKTDKELIIKIIPFYSRAVKSLTRKQRHDRKVILSIMKLNGLALEYCNSTWKKDNEIIFTALAENPKAIEYVPSSIINKRNFPFVINCVRQRPRCILYLNPKCFEPIQLQTLILEAINQERCIIYWLTTELLKLIDIKKLVHEKPSLLQYLADAPDSRKVFSKELQQLTNDPDVVLKVLGHSGFHGNVVGKDLLKDRKFLATAIKMDKAFRYLDKTIKDDDFLMDIALSHLPSNIQYASERIRSQKATIKEVVRKDGSCLKLVPYVFQDDEEIVAIALSQNPHNLRYASKNIRDRIMYSRY
jgi:hypothetical protein